MKKLSKLSAALFFFLFTCSVWAMIPPAYLSVPYWKSCVGTMTRGNAQYVCLPKHRPFNCPRASWRALKHGRLLPYCPRRLY